MLPLLALFGWSTQTWITVLSSPVLVAIVPFISRIWEWYTSRKVPKTIDIAAKVYAALGEALFRMTAARILVTSTHNCGGPIRPDVILFVDALYEVVTPGVEPRLGRMTNIRIGGFHVKLLQKLINDDVEWVDRVDVPKESYLRTIMDADEMETSCFFMISWSADRIITGCISFKDRQPGVAALNDVVTVLQTELKSVLS